MKTRIYIETSVISYLTAKRSHDIRLVADQNDTCEWWENKSNENELFISELVYEESNRGDERAASRRIDILDKLLLLNITDNVISLARQLVMNGALPEKAADDATHLAVAACNNMEFLLTWNCRHINNVVMKPKIREICDEFGYVCPVICTPTELLLSRKD
jgi:predicted nucleic acid-binding protein